MAAQPDYSDSCMIALYPPLDVAKMLALPGGLDPADMHVTVVYTGAAADVDPQRLLAAARSVKVAPFTATISGSARFTGGDQDVLVALVDAPELEELRAATLTALRAQGIEVPRERGYCAHLTRRYQSTDQPDDTGRLDAVDIPFTALTVVHGNDRTDIPLTAPKTGAPPGVDGIAEAARDAYAQGWALSGGPMTERVKTGCATAVTMACKNPHTPGLLELSLHLGRLEGAWAKVYQRREQLIADHTQRATLAWKQVLTRDLLAGAVSDFRRRAGLMESDTPDASRTQQIKDAALAAAASMLQALRNRPEWRGLVAAIRKAVTAGRAEGIVGAVAVAAEQVHKTGLDWDLAFTHAYQGLENLDALWAHADGWLGRMLDRATADLGRALAQAAAAEATYAQTLAAAMDALDSEDVDAVSFVVDWAMTEALRRGAIDLYASEGVLAIDWLDAGDSRVCYICEGNAAGSPYSPADYPELPHPRCRCSPSSSFDISAYAAWFTAA